MPLRDDRRGRRASLASGHVPLVPDFRALDGAPRVAPSGEAAADVPAHTAANRGAAAGEVADAVADDAGRTELPSNARDIGAATPDATVAGTEPTEAIRADDCGDDAGMREPPRVDRKPTRFFDRVRTWFAPAGSAPAAGSAEPRYASDGAGEYHAERSFADEVATLLRPSHEPLGTSTVRDDAVTDAPRPGDGSGETAALAAADAVGSGIVGHTTDSSILPPAGGIVVRASAAALK